MSPRCRAKRWTGCIERVGVWNATGNGQGAIFRIVYRCRAGHVQWSTVWV